MNGNEVTVSMRGVRKRFGAVQALSNVDFEAQRGCINVIIGENGAGKTTLMRILFGLESPDTGRIEVNGKQLPHSHTARFSINLGMGMLQQHLSLIPSFTVLENTVLGCEPVKGLQIDSEHGGQRIAKILTELGSEVKPNSLVSDLPTPSRQQVEIARLLYTGADILIFDEPTATLAPHEAERLYALARRMADSGKTIIVITHRLGEVLSHGDNATVLRRGRVTARLGRSDLTEDRLISAIVPDAPELEGKDRRPDPIDFEAPAALVLAGVDCLDRAGRVVLHGVNSSLHPGEILAVAGVAGSGQPALAETIVGLRRPSGGEIYLGDKKITGTSTGQRRRHGLVYIPEDRLADGVIPSFSLNLNRLLGEHRSRRFRARLSYNTAILEQDVIEKMEEFEIEAAGPDFPLASLSGGNQQKFLLAREFERSPKVVVAHNPTRGLDLMAARGCYRRILELSRMGAAVVLFSTELRDLLQYSHRVGVLFGGRFIDAGRSDKLSVKEIGLLMTRGEGQAA